MSIESTVELSREEAVRLCAQRLGETLANLNSMDDEKVENLLYATRNSIFDNYSIVGE